jgi:hypothetical protein
MLYPQQQTFLAAVWLSAKCHTARRAAGMRSAGAPLGAPASRSQGLTPLVARTVSVGFLDLLYDATEVVGLWSLQRRERFIRQQLFQP